MKWYVAVPVLTVLGSGFWMLLDVYRLMGGGSLVNLDPAAFVGMGAWFLAVWSGMVIRAWY